MAVGFSRNISDYRTFGFRGKTFSHIADGWCVRQVTNTRRRHVFRLYHGLVLYDRWRPDYVTAVEGEAGTRFVEFESFAEAVAFIEGRRPTTTVAAILNHSN